MTGVENAEHENSAPNSRGGKCETWKYGKDALWNTNTTFTVKNIANNAVESFHSGMYAWTSKGGPSGYVRLPGASATSNCRHISGNRKNQRGPCYSPCQAWTSSVTCMNVINDARIKTCITRHDNGSYTRLQFLCAVSHSVGAHCRAIRDVRLDSDSESEDEPADQPAVPAPPQDDRNNDGSTASYCARNLWRMSRKRA